MNKNYYALIMAGGVGSRFWPVSTQKFPKQFHDMLGTGESLLQRTFHRLEKIIPASNILIATNLQYEKLVLEQLPFVSKNQFLLEPAMRNTAPCILYAASKIYQLNNNAVMIVAPSDHWIDDEKEFIQNIQQAFDACEKDDILMTLGIKPSSPNTGYGYINFEKSENSIKKVKQFTEKPNLENAIKFVDSGDYLWNAGIFIWSVKSILLSFKNNLPMMNTLFEKGDKLWNSEEEVTFINTHYEKAENISIDYGIIEKATNVYVLPVDFGWNDLGTWGSLYDKLEKDAQNNALIGGEVIFRNASNNMVKTTSHKKVVIQGLNDYIVIENEDVILICPKQQEQDIKQITAEVKNNFGIDFT
ncbi:MAG: mannose-1-phosphate guanylyltransferase [Flavobacteriaceae bacterium]|nr:mannose-1-phosphate guanylyltransferase [Flavobacteriaceae bacterium]